MNGFIHVIWLQTSEHNFMTIHNDGCKNALVATSIPVGKTYENRYKEMKNSNE